MEEPSSSLAKLITDKVLTTNGALTIGGIGVVGLLARNYLTSRPQADISGINRSGTLTASDFNSRRNIFNAHSMKIAGILSGVSIAGYALYSARNWIWPNTFEWGRASQFGIAGKYMHGGISEGYGEDMDAKGINITTTGTKLHEQIQKRITQYNPNIIPEYTIRDTDVKITGHVDILMPMSLEGKKVMVPTEIKTVSSEGLARLSAPKEFHRAQGQFYMHALTKQAKEKGTEAPPFEQFLYVSRDNPSKFKVFRVKRSEKEFQWYLKRYREYQRKFKNEGDTPKKLYSHLTLAKEIMSQKASIPLNLMTNTSQEPMTINQFNTLITDVIGNEFGINRSDKNALDMGSPIKKVWHKPSIDVAKKGVRKIKSTRLSKPARQYKLTTMKRSGRANSKYGPMHPQRATRLSYNETTQSRLSSVV